MIDLQKRLGWKRGLPEPKLYSYVPPCGAIALPQEADLESQCPGVYDQEDLGSCTAQAAAGLAQFTMKKTGRKWFVPSRLAIYYWTRELEGTVTEDAGASLQDTMKVLINRGTPHESIWWYNSKKFAVKPNKKVEADGLRHLVMQRIAVPQDIVHMQSCLAEGFPFIFGFTVYQSFLSNAVAKSGICPMPRVGEQIVGGHAVCVVGFSNQKQMVKVRNSWSKDWGQKGYFWMPYNYILDRNLCDDFWTMRDFKTFS